MNGKDTVLKNFDLQMGRKVHWKIYYGYAPSAGQLAASTEVIPGELDAALSRERLASVLDLLPQGEYLIQFKDAPTSNNNIISTRFVLGFNDSANSPIVRQESAMKGYLSPDQHNQLLQAEIGRLSAEFQQKAVLKEMQDMMKEMKDLKKNSGGTNWNEIISGAKQLMDSFKGISAAETTPLKIGAINGPKQDAKERQAALIALYQQAMAEWGEAEGGGELGAENFMHQICCLNEYRKENPGMWNALKPQIMKMGEKLNLETKEEETNNG